MKIKNNEIIYDEEESSGSSPLIYKGKVKDGDIIISVAPDKKSARQTIKLKLPYDYKKLQQISLNLNFSMFVQFPTIVSKTVIFTSDQLGIAKEVHSNSSNDKKLLIKIQMVEKELIITFIIKQNEPTYGESTATIFNCDYVVTFLEDNLYTTKSRTAFIDNPIQFQEEQIQFTYPLPYDFYSFDVLHLSFTMFYKNNIKGTIEEDITKNELFSHKILYYDNSITLELTPTLSLNSITLFFGLDTDEIETILTELRMDYNTVVGYIVFNNSEIQMNQSVVIGSTDNKLNMTINGGLTVDTIRRE